MRESLFPCDGCRRHVRATEPSCPFCGAAVHAPASAPVEFPARLSRAALFAFAMAAGGCTPSAPAPPTEQRPGEYNPPPAPPPPPRLDDPGPMAAVYGAPPPPVPPPPVADAGAAQQPPPADPQPPPLRPIAPRRTPPPPVPVPAYGVAPPPSRDHDAPVRPQRLEVPRYQTRYGGPPPPNDADWD